jgi:hypothetical protein
VSRNATHAKQGRLERRFPLLALMMTLSVSSSLASPTICDMNGECVDHSGAPAPYFGTDPQHPHAGWGGGGPVFNLWAQEPYRNSDMGPLGVVLSTGEFQITATDFEIPGRGVPFRLSRTYRSKQDGEQSLLGHNWHLGNDEYLTPGFYNDDGIPCEAVRWTMGNGWHDIWVNQCQRDGMEGVRGLFRQIRQLPGAGTGYQIRSADGTVKTFAQEARDADNFVIWLLTRIEDRHGNALTIHHAGRGIDKLRNSAGRSPSTCQWAPHA